MNGYCTFIQRFYIFDAQAFLLHCEVIDQVQTEVQEFGLVWNLIDDGGFSSCGNVTPFMDLMVEAITVALCDAQYPAGQQQLEVLPNMPTTRQCVEEFSDIYWSPEN